jgi:outer membrane protein TolC
VALACVGLWPAVAPGQRATGDSALDALVAQALAGNPAIRAAAMRVDAARARVGPAGARPDPMLMLGVVDFPYHQPGFADNFTMNTVRLTQAIPYPGKLSLATRAADEDAESARALLDQTKLDAVRDVEIAYYQLAYLRRAREIVEQNSAVLGGLVKVAQARYEVGTGVQADALRARIEAARLGDQASVLAAQERTALARLNAVLDRPSDTPVDAPEIPLRIARLAVADSASRVQFSSAALGAAPNDSPLLPVDSIVALAVARSPMLRAHEAQIAAQERRLALAEKAHLPDFDVSLEYDQRPHFPDYLSFFVSVPLPLQRARKQNQDVAAARADLAALHAEHATEVDAVRTEVASLTSDAERSRTQLALSVKAVLPQAHAALASATASYEVGRIDFPALVDAQAELFNEETAYARALTDFATTLARLVSVVGTAEVVR